MEFSLDELNLNDADLKKAKDQSKDGFNPFEILGVSLDASSLEIREAYLRMKTTFQGSNESMYSLMSQEEMAAKLADMDRAYDELRDIDTRGKYLQELDPTGSQHHTRYAGERSAVMAKKELDFNSLSHSRVSVSRPAEDVTPSLSGRVGSIKARVDQAGNEELQEKLAEIIASDERGSGETIVRLREVADLDRQTIEFTTKVSAHIIDAVEQDDFANLPAPVYVRGFLKSFFKFLGMKEQKEFIDRFTERLNSAKR